MGQLRKCIFYIRVVPCFLALFFASGAWAYFAGSTPTDGVELKDGPSPSANTIKVLPKGTSFNAADTATSGYYRVRTATDTGWIDGAAIGKGQANQSTSLAPTTQAPPRNGKRPVAKKNVRRTKSSNPYYAVKVFGNYNSTSSNDASAAIGSTDFNSVVSFGGSFMWFFQHNWGVGLRIERFSKTVSGVDSTGTHNLSFSVSSTPIMVGTEYLFLEDSQFYLSGAGFLGLASTSFTSSDQTKGTTGTFSGTAFTLLLNLEGGYELTKSFSLFGELGYRVLNASSTTLSGDPSPIPATATVGLNLSGLTAGIGLKLSF